MGKRKTYTVKEFDRLVPEKRAKSLSSSNNVTVLSDSDFDELTEYLFSSVKDEGKQLFKVMNITNHHYDKAIQLKNYVGLIELPKSKNRIEILPKVYSGNKEISDINAIKNILLSMLSSLKDFPALDLGSTSVDTKRMCLYEIFIRIFLGRLLELVKRGLKSDYSEVTENSNYFRGCLEIALQIKHNAAHGERFYVRHDEYNLSRPENRILKSAVIKLLKVTEDQENAFLARRLLVYFDEIPESTDFEADYRRISFDSSNQGYLGVIQWAMVFLRNKSFSIFGGTTTGQSLLFPMDRIFEQYVASQIARLINLHNKKYGTHYRFVSQDATKYLFDVPKSFKIRPDIKISDEETVLLDTKWKILSDKGNKTNISQEDMYQMYAYSKRYNAGLVYLLYPESQTTASIKQRDFEASNDILKTHVSIEFLDLGNMVKMARTNSLDTKSSLYSFLLKILKNQPGASMTLAAM